jgi:tRNA A-37 threonylcarbamoyl transferase component Bud32
LSASDTIRLDTSTSAFIHNPRVRRAARIAWIAVVVLALVVNASIITYFYSGNVPLADRYLAQLAEFGLTQSFFNLFSDATYYLYIGVYVLAGLFMFWRRSDDWIVWLMALGLVLNGVQWTARDIPYITLPLLQVAHTLSRFVTNIVINAAIGIFPNGRFVPRWLRWLFITYVLVDGFRLCLLLAVSHVGDAGDTLLSVSNTLFYLSFAYSIVAVFAQIYRYRHVTSSIQRQQTKWVLLGIGLVVAREIITAMLLESIMGEDPHILAVMVRGFVLNLMGLILPITVTIAILRYRLYDIDFILNRSLVYGLLTLLLGMVFFVGLFALQPIFSTVLGEQQTIPVAIVSTAIIVGLFNPTRKQVQHYVDRRFYGFRFDLNELDKAQRTLKHIHAGGLTGRTLGPYQLLEVIGKGGMGEVYKGEGSGKTVAIKTLPQDLAEQVDFRKRFEREAQTLAAFDHPNIVKTYGFGESGGVFYLAMEFIDGEELGAIIKRRGSIPIEDVRPFAADFAAALDYAHQHGLVHRDIKPSNIMLRQKKDHTGKLEAILMDFGVAKIQDAHTQITGTGAIGTIDYMSPEQIMAAREVDHRADIYALGVVLYEMLTGQRPFKGTPGQVLFAHLQQPAPDPRDLSPTVSEPVAKAVMRALAKDPNDRFQSATELVAALLPA